MTATIEQEAQAAAQFTLAGLCRKAIELIEQAQQEQPRRLSEDVDESERAVVRLRDRLIGHLREDSASNGGARWHTALNHVNAALSLVVGIEYPAGGIQRDMLKQAADTLQALLDDGLLDDDQHR